MTSEKAKISDVATTEFDETRHGFDFPFRAHSPSWADPLQVFTAPCRCGEKIRVPQSYVSSASNPYHPFARAMETHIATERNKFEEEARAKLEKSNDNKAKG